MLLSNMEKIFCIGMFKTGTSSMAIALEKLGYKTLRGPWWPKKIMIKDDFYERPNEWIPYHTTIKHKIGYYDAFVDYPWMFLYDKLDFWYPNSRFVLTVRDPESLARSDIDMLKRIGHSESKIYTKKKIINRYTEHRKKVLEYFKSKNNFIEFDIFKGEGWKKLCSFLNKETPNISFPHFNINALHSSGTGKKEL